jgi:hypothetical protein
MGGKKRNKNRIVINLDQPESGQPRSSFSPSGMGNRGRRRWPRILAVLAAFCIVVVMLALAGAYLWWRSYQTSPAYTVALLVDAAQRNDMPALEGRLDDEAIAKNVVPTVRERASGRYGVSLSGSLQQRIDDLLPVLLPQMKETIHSEIAKEIKELSTRAESKPFVRVALAVSSFVKITTQGDNAQVVAPLPDRVIEVSMRRDGDRWKVVDFKDDVLVQRIVDGLMKDLPAIGGLDLKIPLPGNSGRRSRRRGSNR